MSRRMICAVLGLGLGGILHAQALRDPTQPPPGAMPPAGGASQSAEPLADEGVAVVVRDGKPFLVSGTRLYGVGQKLGAYRIERITETEVWLRNGAELRKQPRFAGITRKESKPMAECTPAAASGKSTKSSKTTSSTSPKAAPCAGAQP
jgi:hypothetical protein